MNHSESTALHSIDLTEFKLRCLEILDQLVPAGILLTKDGRPVAKIMPIAAVNNEALIGSMKDEITIQGDIFSTDLQWDAQS